MTSSAGTPPPVILLIDDEQTLVYLISRYGHASNCQVQSVQLLDEAIARITRAPPALVVLHVAPQHQDRGEVVRSLKSNPTTRTVPLVVVCAASMQAAWLSELGADYCLMKPVLYDDFRSVLMASGAIPPSEPGMTGVSGGIG